MGLTAQQIKALDALTDERAALHHLMGSGGWKYLVEHCNRTGSFAYEHMAKTDNPTVMAKQVGAWHVAQSVIAFPQRRLEEIERLIATMEASQRA